jgi:hypothetical protein
VFARKAPDIADTLFLTADVALRSLLRSTDLNTPTRRSAVFDFVSGRSNERARFFLGRITS